VSNPRAASRPLVVTWKPWYCTSCIEKEKGKPREIRMLRQTTAALVGYCKPKKGWTVIESPHFKIFSSLGKATVKASNSRFVNVDMKRLASIFPRLKGRGGSHALTPHQRAHLYHLRLERLYAHFRALTDNARPLLGMKARYEVFLFARYKSHRVIATGFLNKPRDKAGVRSYLKGSPGLLAMSTSAELFGNDRALHENVRHHVAHNLANGYGDYYRHTWAFLESGVAHWYDQWETNKAITVCHAGSICRVPPKSTWRKSVLRLLKRGKDRSLGGWCEKLYPHELTLNEHMIAWCLVDWMIRTDPVRFTRLLDRVQDLEHKPTAAQAIAEVYGASPDALHQRWRDWAREEYARTSKRP
jgi:hypothetical protein